MADTTNTPQNLEFVFGDIGSIVCTPSHTEKGNWFFAGTAADEAGNRILVDLGDEDPFTVLNRLPAITVNGQVLFAKESAHLSKPGKRSRGGNPTITHSGSATIEVNGEAKGYTLMANVTFLAAKGQQPAGYAVNCKAIPQGVHKARPARGFAKGFTAVKA